MAVARRTWGKYAFEFILIFIAVVAAFALNQWSNDRRDAHAEEKILREIANGLRKDMEDIRTNASGHRNGLRACAYWRQVIDDEAVAHDSLEMHIQTLLRDFISLQNGSGYQSLRSRGLELVTDDSLRSDIIALYEYDMVILSKLEESYGEMQFFTLYRSLFDEVVGPHLRYADGRPVGIDAPIRAAGPDRRRFLLMLWRIERNRSFTLRYYDQLIDRIGAVQSHIDHVLARGGR